MKTLILAIIILAALSLAVWAGLHFYQKSQRGRSRNDGNHGLEFAAAISPHVLEVSTLEIAKEKKHGFIA